MDIDNKNFIISNIFFLSNNNTVLSVKDFDIIDGVDKYEWAIFINGKFNRRIKIISEIILKGSKRHLNERALETKDDLSELKEFDFESNKMILKKEGSVSKKG